MYNNMTNLPFIHEYDYRYIREIRHLRNLTLAEFSRVIKLDPATISKLENNQLQFTINYQSKLAEAVQTLGISELELNSIKHVIQLKQERGIYDDKN